MAVQKLGDVAVGTVVKLKENGVAQDYLVVHQGLPSSLYDASCDGTWLLRKDIYSNQALGSSFYQPSDINTDYLPNDVLPLYDTGIQNKIKTVKIPYVSKPTVYEPVVLSGSEGLSTKLFLLGGYEIGFTKTGADVFEDGAKLSYFSSISKRIANYQGEPSPWWTRSQSIYNSNRPIRVLTSGSDSSVIESTLSGIRPAMILPTDLIVDESGNVLNAPPVPVLTVPSNAMQGQPIPVSWTASESADSYTLQRKADSGEWETVYTGANLQYQDTAGSWSTVQYQVAASADGVFSDYAQSAVIPVISASALVISGSDEDLGTISRDIPYTVTSDTGNEITLVRRVNGQQVASRTVQSGFSYNIPVLDLPTGKGTIEISASVQASGGPVTAKRTWQYEKTALQWPNAGGVGQLTQNGKNVFPLTLAEAVRTAGGVGLDKILEQLMPLIGNGVSVLTGSYIGTGTSGADNPTVLTAPGEILLAIVGERDGSAGPYLPPMVLVKGATKVHGVGFSTQSVAAQYTNTVEWNGNEVAVRFSSYRTTGSGALSGSYAQYNEKSSEYFYVIFYKPEVTQ